MVQEAYGSKISCLHSPFLLEGRKGLSRSPFYSYWRRQAPTFIYHLQFTIYNFPYVFPAPQDSTESGAKKKPSFESFFLVYETIFSFLFRN